MANEQHNWLGPYLGSEDWIHQLAQQLKLFYYLMRDRRVHWLAKAIPVATAIYLVSPVDWLQNAVPVLGQIGDVALVALAFRLFLEFSPPEVVHEHLTRLLQAQNEGKSWSEVDNPPAARPDPDQDVIEGSFREDK